MTFSWLGILTAVCLVLALFHGYHCGFVRELVSTLFIVFAMVVVWFINPYVNDFLRENTPVYEKIQGSFQSAAEDKIGEGVTGAKEQQSFIEELNLPALLKKDMSDNNNAAVYNYLSVGSFTEYISDYLAVRVVNGLSFVISYLLATILIRMVTYALDLLSRLPIINGVNKLAGGLLGVGKCVIFIWIALLVLTLLCSTEIGKKGMELVENDTFLSLLYDNNILMKVFTDIFYGN